MKQNLCIEIKGKHKNWSFPFKGDPKYIPEWEADGLTVTELLNSIPEWAVDLGLLRPWVFVQDCWQKMRLW